MTSPSPVKKQAQLPAELEPELERKARITKVLRFLSISTGLAAFAMAWRDVPIFFSEVMHISSVSPALTGLLAAAAGITMAFLVLWGAMGLLKKDFSKIKTVHRRPDKLGFMVLFGALSAFIAFESAKEWFDSLTGLFNMHHASTLSMGIVMTVSAIAGLFFVAWLTSRLSDAYDQISDSIIKKYERLILPSQKKIYVLALGVFAVSLFLTVTAGMVFHEYLPAWLIVLGVTLTLASSLYIGKDGIKDFAQEYRAQESGRKKAMLLAKALDHCLLLFMMIVHSSGEGGVPGRSMRDDAGALAGAGLAGGVLVVELGVDYPSIAGKDSADGHDHRLKFFQLIVHGFLALKDYCFKKDEADDESSDDDSVASSQPGSEGSSVTSASGAEVPPEHHTHHQPKSVRIAWAGLAITGSLAYVMYTAVEFHTAIAWAGPAVMVFIVVAGLLTEGSVMNDGVVALNYAFKPTETLKADLIERKKPVTQVIPYRSGQGYSCNSEMRS